MDPIVQARVIETNHLTAVVKILKGQEHAGLIFELPVDGITDWRTIRRRKKKKEIHIVDIVVIRIFDNATGRRRRIAKWPPRLDDPPIEAESA